MAAVEIKVWEAGDSAGIEQAGAVPFRRAESRIEFLLITTRKGKWSIPKGIIDPGETPEETATKEVLEEAGAVGRVVSGPIGTYRYRKWGESLRVTGYLFEVERLLDHWEDSDFRERAWCSPEEALRRITRDGPRSLVECAIRLLSEDGDRP